MSKRKKVIYGVVGVVGVIGVGIFVAIGLSIFAMGNHRHDHGPGLMTDRMLDKMAEALHLDETQKNTLLSAAEKSKQEWDAVQKQMHESRKAMHYLDPKAYDYDVKVAGLAKTNADLAIKMTMMRASMKSTMADVLTDAQMQEVKKILNQAQ